VKQKKMQKAALKTVLAGQQTTEEIAAQDHGRTAGRKKSENEYAFTLYKKRLGRGRRRGRETHVNACNPGFERNCGIQV